MMKAFTAACLCIGLFSCSTQKQIAKTANRILLKDSAISSGHIGISIYDPLNNTYLYNYNADKYFIPASNTKLFTLYAGMKYLGDSLVGLKYTENNIVLIDSTVPITDLVKVFPTGDPTFLNSEFPFQPAFEFLKKQRRFEFCDFNDIESLGKGWAWDDYMEEYMTQRSSFPMYKNLIDIQFIKKDSISIQPKYFKNKTPFIQIIDSGFSVFKNFHTNEMSFIRGKDTHKKVPFSPYSIAENIERYLETKFFE